MKTTSSFNRSRTRQGERIGKGHLLTLEKEVVRGSPMEPSGAVSVGYHLGFEPLSTREPMLSPFHAYSIAHKMRFVKGFSKKVWDFLKKFLEKSWEMRNIFLGSFFGGIGNG